MKTLKPHDWAKLSSSGFSNNLPLRGHLKIRFLGRKTLPRPNKFEQYSLPSLCALLTAEGSKQHRGMERSDTGEPKTRLKSGSRDE
jgi:hypothetical protein